MKELQTTYGDLFKMMKTDTDNKYFIKTEIDCFARINAMVQKKSDTYIVDFEEDFSIEAGDQHVFKNAIGQPVYVKDLEPGEEVQTIHGNNIIVSARHSFKVDQDVYDICIDNPHWYTNDDRHGIIHHNTSFALLMASAYLKHYDDAVILFYDSEFGSPQAYFQSFGIDVGRVIHTPIKSIEELKFDLIGQLEGLVRKDKIIIVIDSLGNLASKKELDDAIGEKSVADMTRAKAFKSLFRMVTPYLTTLDIPLIGVNHIYMTQEMFSKPIVSGGTGITYSADNVWIIGRRQDKDGTEVAGYHFIINVEKSRFVKEKSKIPITVSWAGGIEKYSGLLEIAVEGGYVYKPKNGWYIGCDPKSFVPEIKDPKTKKITIEAIGALTKSMREADTMNKEFWDAIFKHTDFAGYIKDKFSVGHINMLSDDSTTDLVFTNEEDMDS